MLGIVLITTLKKFNTSLHDLEVGLMFAVIHV